jgi:hypothetical protein
LNDGIEIPRIAFASGQKKKGKKKGCFFHGPPIGGSSRTLPLL